MVFEDRVYSWFWRVNGPVPNDTISHFSESTLNSFVGIKNSCRNSTVRSSSSNPIVRKKVDVLDFPGVNSRIIEAPTKLGYQIFKGFCQIGILRILKERQMVSVRNKKSIVHKITNLDRAIFYFFWVEKGKVFVRSVCCKLVVISYFGISQVIAMDLSTAFVWMLLSKSMII